MSTPFFRFFGLMFFLFCGNALLCSILAQAKLDTTKVYSIDEITITESHQHPNARSTTPVQALDAKSMGQIQAMSVSDASKFFAGISIKDYGGIGGLKTVSVRSLGANHTVVSLDGISLTDCQTGQIDIGRFSLENVEMLTLQNGQSDDIFMPARQFSSASHLQIRTLQPQFKEAQKLTGKATQRLGSFGLVNPALSLAAKISSVYVVSLSAELLEAVGNYPYTLYYGTAATDSSSVEIRQNTDVHNLRLEAAVFAKFSPKEQAHFKTYYYQSERGLPGATVFYNTTSYSKQRIWDNTFFTQAHYEKEFSNSFSFQSNAKYNRGKLRYLDPSYLDANGVLDNIYTQQEYYGSVSILYKPLDKLSISASTDGAVNLLETNQQNDKLPVRSTSLTSLAAKYESNQLIINSSLLATLSTDKIKSTDESLVYQKLSPFFSLSYKPFVKENFRLRFFYKNIFRLPSFNDLYYTQVGNRNLKPEKVNQWNVGTVYSLKPRKWLPLFSFTMDAYQNNVEDKIVAYPSSFFWTILNKGKVKITGLDLQLESALRVSATVNVSLGASYSYQKALNVSSPTDADYMHQLPYTPRVSGSERMGVDTKWAWISYSVLWSGHRYAVNQNYAENRLPGYADQSISLGKFIPLKTSELALTLEMLNLMNVNYAIIKWYPLPGRSFRAICALKF